MIDKREPINIRMAVEDDIPRILEIEHDAISPPWPHGALLSEIYSDDSCFLVYEAYCDGHDYRVNNSCDCSGTVRFTSGFVAAAKPPASSAAADTAASIMLDIDSDAPQLLGFIILRQVGDESELFQIAVDKQARGHGIANAMLQAATLWARNRNVKTVFLEARVSNLAAISLYHKNGFCDVGRRSKYFTHPVEDAFLMTLQL